MESIRLGSKGVLCLKYANRHGLITGATGSGKTSSMIRLAAEFNAHGVPVFIPDMKGDVYPRVPEHLRAVFKPGENFHLSFARLGPDLTARALNLTDAQQGAIEEYALAAHTPAGIAQRLSSSRSATARVVRRAMNRLPGKFFSPNDFDVARLISPTVPVTVLQCAELMDCGNLYAATVVYMLRDLYSRMAEVGDGKPLLTFFIDEAHMLFRDIPRPLLAELEKIVRLIRSKGVSLWFVTQSPADIPASILGQLQNRVQHSLRAATPADWNAVKVAVDTMPAPAVPIDLHDVIGSMRPGFALVSFVNATGVPQPSEFVSVRVPCWDARRPVLPLADSPVADATATSLDAATPAQDGLGADPFSPTHFDRALNFAFALFLVVVCALALFECGLLCLALLIVVCASTAFMPRRARHRRFKFRRH